MGALPPKYEKDETGAVKKSWKGRTHVVLVYPNHYPVGMSNLGFQAVYQLLNAIDHVLCERAFLPENGAGKAIRSVESGRRLSTFDVIAFSISFEIDFPNLLSILDQADIPLQAGIRGSPHPLILAGGVACLLNPEPIAPFIDCFVIGEAEPVLSDFFSSFDPRRDRLEMLEDLAVGVPGTYVPAFYAATYHPDGTLKSFTPNRNVPATVTRRYVKDLSATPTCSAVLTPHTHFGETYLVELARGCPHGCRFCSAGYIYRPPRFRSRALLDECIARGLHRTRKIGLVSTAVSDVPHLVQLCRKALDADAVISFSSLRIDGVNPEIVSVLKKSRVKTATLAPDAGSERMRSVINKGITEADILAAVALLVAGGIPNLKLYFMVGLPTETMADVDAIVALCKRIKERFLKESRRMRRIGTITVSLNAFIPKPFTPFQWAPMDDPATLKMKWKRIKTGLKRVANTRVKTDPLNRDRFQALLSRADRRAARILLRHHRSGATWSRTLRADSEAFDFYATRERGLDEKLPWDFIDHGIRKAFLAEEYRKAKRGRVSSPCPLKDCNRCGVCTDPRPLET